MAIRQQSQQRDLVVQVDLHIHCQLSCALVGHVHHLFCLFYGIRELLPHGVSGCASVHAPKDGLLEGEINCLFAILKHSLEFCGPVDHGKKMLLSKVQFLSNILLFLTDPVVLDHNFLLFVKIVVLQVLLVLLEA